MSDNKILSFEEFINNGANAEATGEVNPAIDNQIDGDSENLPVPAEEVETGETEHNVPNNMIDDEPATDETGEGEAPEADVQIEAEDDVDKHVD